MNRYGLSDEQYRACEDIATKAYERLSEPLQQAITKITQSITDEANKYILEWLEADTQSNFRSLVRERAETIIKGLFGKKYDEETAKQWLGGWDFELYRETVYRNYPDVVVNKLLEDTLKENEKLKKDIEYYRRNY